MYSERRGLTILEQLVEAAQDYLQAVRPGTAESAPAFCEGLAVKLGLPAVEGQAVGDWDFLRHSLEEELDLASGEAPAGAARAPIGKIAAALGILSVHPDWTNKQIAEAVGCHVKYLSQSPRFRAARRAIKDAGKEEHRRAFRSRGSDMDEYGDE
jgi:hypothetical protein